jgi:hypothetical protein
MRAGDTLSRELREAEVEGLDGRRQLGDLLGGLTLIVFLREFG